MGDRDGAQRAAASARCEGVGLFRTEMLYLDRAVAPTQSEQVDAYATVLEALAPHPGAKVVVRTLDAGADKPIPFAGRGAEDNPALGVRGYRLVRYDCGLLDTQLRAIAQASARYPGVDTWVMAPMVSTAAEAEAFARAARDAGLAEPVKVGVMIEVPAAALRAADILRHVDFVSLGTNDLAQYTMAADRLNGELADLLDPFSPAVLDLVAVTAKAGAELAKPVGVCGESAADPLMALVLAGLGITSLSMAPAAQPAVRYALRHHTLGQCQQIAAAAVSASSPAEARAAALALCAEPVRDTLRLAPDADARPASPPRDSPGTTTGPPLGSSTAPSGRRT